MSTFDVIIRNGRLLDAATNLDVVGDVGIVDGIIVSVGVKLDETEAETIVDAAGMIVTAGWIDVHAHVYEHATVLGVNPDRHCLARGVTTVADAGSSGAMTFAGLRRYIVEASATRVLAWLHVSNVGLAGAGCSGKEFGSGGECDSINAVNVRQCVDCVKANRDIIVGIKVRLDKNITDCGRNEAEVYKRALEASSQAGVPLMVHHTNSGISLAECPGQMRKGDVYTHAYHGHGSSILDRESGLIDGDVINARGNGVLMDVGHGQGSLDWSVAEAALAQNLWPDTISTDLHSGNVDGPVHDLAHVMSKFLGLGVPLEKVISCVTSSAASAIGQGSSLGSLAVGREADITVFAAEETDVQAYDSFGKSRTLNKIIVPKAVFRRGKQFKIDCC